MTIDPRSDRPLYHQIADQLRAQINQQTLQPGQKLPSERELMEQYSTARETIRRALRVLTTEGLVDAQRGVGAFVRERGPVRRVSTDRFARRHRQAGLAALQYEAESQNRTWRQDLLERGETQAPAEVAARLNIEEGDPVFVRRRLMWVDDVPMQYADSYFLPDMVRGTAITEEVTGPGGVYARLEDEGHTLTRFTEELSFRMPTPDEARGLRLNTGVPVVDLTRVAYSNDQPVEVFTAVMAGDKHTFVYEFPAPE